MFVTNLTNEPLGIDGIINLSGSEKDRYLPETEDLVARVRRLENAKLVSVSFTEGLEKPLPVAADEPKAQAEIPAETPAEADTEVSAPAATDKGAKGGAKNGAKAGVDAGK